MTFVQEFIPLELGQLHREAAVMKVEGWRFIQTHAVNTDDGIDLYYSFMKDGVTRNYHIAGVTKDQPVPTITDLFLAAFVFENEARELFGVDMRDIAIDFAGNLYAPAEFEPMTFLSPEQKAAREKAKKAAADKAAKVTGAAGDEAATAPAKSGFVMTPERQARLDAKMATMSPEKKAKVEAALARIAAADSAPAPAAEPASAEVPKVAESVVAEPAPEKAEAKDAALEEKLANMDPEKAAKVRAALAKKGAPAESAAVQEPAEEASAKEFADEQLAALISLMDESKASIVRAALNMKGGE